MSYSQSESVAILFVLTNGGKLKYSLGGDLEHKDQSTLELHEQDHIKNL